MGVAGGIEGGGEGRVVAGEVAASGEVSVKGGGALEVSLAEGGVGVALLGGDAAGGERRQNGGSGNVDEQGGARVVRGGEIQDEREASDEDGGAQDRGQSPDELAVGANAQEVTVLPSQDDGEEEQDRQPAQRGVEA